MKGTTVDRLLCGIVVIVVKVVTLPGSVVVIPPKVGANVDVATVVRFRKADADVADAVAFAMLWVINGVIVVEVGNRIEGGNVGTVSKEERIFVTFNVI